MATEFVMPKLGLTMEEGTITDWLVDDGTEVSPGTAVLVIETDKVASEVESPGAGRFVRAASVGETFACGDRIGWLLADGEDVPDPPDGQTAAPAAASADRAPAHPEPHAAPAPAAAAADGRILASPNARRVAAIAGIDVTRLHGTGPGGRIVSEDVEDALADPSLLRPTAPPAPAPGAWAPAPTGTASAAPATAAARQLADLLGVDIRLVSPAADGRRSREDVASYVRSRLAQLDEIESGPPTKASSAPAPTQQPTRIVPFTGMRGAIADRMHRSLTEMAQLTLTMDASMDAVVADRAQRKADADGAAVPTFTDYVVAATARALADHPIVNSQVTEEGIALLPEIHVGMAVALDEGLLVPVIANTLSLDLPSLAAESSRLATAARERTLGLAELEGGTFSVSTLGAFGVDAFTPVINPPNAAILGVGRLRSVVSLTDGDVTESTAVTLSLTWDHRVFDGAPAARFTARIVELLAEPAALAGPAAP